MKKEIFVAEIGERIAEVGIKKFGSQAKFAEAIGVNHNVFSKWKNGKNAPDGYTLYKICESTGTSAEYLFFGEDSAFREFDFEIFNEVYDLALKFVKKHKMEVKGDFFIAIYNEVRDLQKKNNLSATQAMILIEAEFVEKHKK